MRRFPLCAALTTAFGVMLCAAAPAAAQQYSARRDGEVVRLEDAANRIVVSVLPAVGNIAFSMTVNGHSVLRWPFASVADFKAKPSLSGIPFLGPWANRLDEQAFYANGTRYPFDMDLGNVRGAIPIHGFLSTTSQWQVVELHADDAAAWLTSRLEFFRQPAWMQQWPFAHTIEMTYRLQDGTLEVRTTISNMSADAMPIAIGFHPYFQLTDSRRDQWTLSVPARTRWLLAPNKVPTGATEAIEQLFPNPGAVPLRDYNLDDVFSDLPRDSAGRATVSLIGKSQRLDVVLGRNFRAAVVWAPHPANIGRGSQALGAANPPARGAQPQPAQDRNFVCIEPMTGITNALNLAHRGRYNDLQTVAAGGTWRESFWIRPAGF
jgi:aldose 1-epimerase